MPDVLMIAVSAALATAPGHSGDGSCLRSSPLVEVQVGAAAADRHGRSVGRVQAVECRPGFSDAQIVVRTGPLGNRKLKAFPARTVRMVRGTLVIPLSAAEIDAMPERSAAGR